MTHPELLGACARTARVVALAARSQDSAAYERAVARLKKTAAPLLGLPAKSRLGRIARQLSESASACAGSVDRAKALDRQVIRVLADLA